MAVTFFSSLPDGDLVEVEFLLRLFRRWGAEQDEDGTWRFFLASD